MEKNNHIFVNNKKIIYELIKERQDKNMSTGLFGWVVGAAFIAAQVVFIWALGRILTVFSDRILPEVEE